MKTSANEDRPNYGLVQPEPKEKTLCGMLIPWFVCNLKAGHDGVCSCEPNNGEPVAAQPVSEAPAESIEKMKGRALAAAQQRIAELEQRAETAERERDEAYEAIRLLMNRKPHENANMEAHPAVRRAMEQGADKDSL